MPWKASSVMEEKIRFVVEYEQDNYTMSELCGHYGIARETGYVWLRRYPERGGEGVVEVNPAAPRHGNQTTTADGERVVEGGAARMPGGPRELRRAPGRGQRQQ